MAVGIPVGGRVGDRRGDLVPGLEAAALERERAERLPPGLDQVQVGCVGRLEDELPAWVGQDEEQDIGRPVGVQVVQDGVDALDLGRGPRLDALQEVS